MKLHICTYFDINFLSRGLALYHSIKKYHTDFQFYVLAFDNETYNYLLSLGESSIVPISFDTYNSFFNTSVERFADKKQYYFTATPNICIYVLEKYPLIDILLYLDADVYLFSSLEPLYLEFGDNSIGICPHRLHPIAKRIFKNHGIYNVGVNLFRNSEIGRKCLNDWKIECETWYKGKPGYHLQYFSDQIFLDKWPEKYLKVKIIENIGVDVAPWNATNYSFVKEDDIYLVNGHPLIIFHFSALKKINIDSWNGNSLIYLTSIKGALLDLYYFYIQKIESYKISDSKIVTINLSGKFLKRLFRFLFGIYLNEKIKL